MGYLEQISRDFEWDSCLCLNDQVIWDIYWAKNYPSRLNYGLRTGIRSKSEVEIKNEK